ncbi:MAG: hypothetical protein ABIH25_01265 [Candidatus Woesearchaeota archaeon]
MSNKLVEDNSSRRCIYCGKKIKVDKLDIALDNLSSKHSYDTERFCCYMHSNYFTTKLQLARKLRV